MKVITILKKIRNYIGADANSEIMKTSTADSEIKKASADSLEIKKASFKNSLS